MLSLLELGLAAWRLSRMAVKEGGPYHVFADLRARTGIEYGPDGAVVSYPDWNPLHCVLCTSLYAGVLLLFSPRWLRRLLAAGGVAVLLESANMRLARDD